MLKLKIQYPQKKEEREIIRRYTKETDSGSDVEAVITREDVFTLQKCVENVYLDEKIENYVLDIVFKTREPSSYIACGASPRASINLIKASKCRAFLSGRNHVVPDDVKSIVYDVLRHRILLSYEAEAEDVTSESLIADILETVNLP